MNDFIKKAIKYLKLNSYELDEFKRQIFFFMPSIDLIIDEDQIDEYLLSEDDDFYEELDSLDYIDEEIIKKPLSDFEITKLSRKSKENISKQLNIPLERLSFTEALSEEKIDNNTYSLFYIYNIIHNIDMYKNDMYEELLDQIDTMDIKELEQANFLFNLLNSIICNSSKVQDDILKLNCIQEINTMQRIVDKNREQIQFNSLKSMIKDGSIDKKIDLEVIKILDQYRYLDKEELKVKILENNKK